MVYIFTLYSIRPVISIYFFKMIAFHRKIFYNVIDKFVKGDMLFPPFG